MTNRVMAKGSSVCLEGGDGEGKMSERFGDDEFPGVFVLPMASRHTSVARARASEWFGNE